MFTVLETLDNVEEDFKQFFEEVEGRFKFDKKKYDLAVQAPVNTKNRELLGKLAKTKDLDDADLERARKLKAKAEKLSIFDEWLAAEDDEADDGEDAKSKSKVSDKDIRAAVQAEKKRLTDAHAAALKAEQDKVAAIEQRFEQQQLEDEVEKLALEHGVIPKRLGVWKDALLRRFRHEDGELVFLENGKPSTTITAEQAVRDVIFKDDAYNYLYEAREAGGGSGKGGKGGNGKSGNQTLTRAQFEKLTPVAAAAFMVKVRKGEASLSD